MIEIMKNGELNPKKLTSNELEFMVDFKLRYYKRQLSEDKRR